MHVANQRLNNYPSFQVMSECNKAEQWLRERAQQQDSLPKNTDPVLWSHEIKKRTEALDMYRLYHLVSSLFCLGVSIFLDLKISNIVNLNSVVIRLLNFFNMLQIMQKYFETQEFPIENRGLSGIRPLQALTTLKLIDLFLTLIHSTRHLCNRILVNINDQLQEILGYRKFKDEASLACRP